MDDVVKGLENLDVSDCSSILPPSLEETFSKKIFLGHTMLSLAQSVTNRLFLEQEGISRITWTNGESNLDSEYSALACRYAEEEWSKIRKECSIFENVEMKASHPDITCRFFDKEQNSPLCPPQKIELKSSMNTSLPGSTSRNLDVSIPIIYCLRPSNKKQRSSNIFHFECGQYIDSMLERGEYDMFQDRSPRPRISFTSLQNVSHKGFKDARFPFDDYLLHLATCSLKRIHSSHRKCVKSSWQDSLVENIVQLLLKTFSEIVYSKLSLDQRENFTKCDLEEFVKDIVDELSQRYISMK